MRVFISVIFICCFLFCNKISISNGVLTGVWKLISYTNVDNGIIVTEPDIIKRSIVLTFKDNGQNGSFEGHTVTNTVFGDYEILSNGKFRVSNFGGTKVGEPSWGENFWDAIVKSSSYSINTQNILIYYNNNKNIMTFQHE